MFYASREVVRYRTSSSLTERLNWSSPICRSLDAPREHPVVPTSLGSACLFLGILLVVHRDKNAPSVGDEERQF